MTENNASKGQESQKEAEKDTEGKVSLPAEPDEPLAIVGIGASAGGLEALEIFFNHMPADSGMAFVVIQHQDPEQTSLLPEILQRFTEMPVTTIDEGVKARPNTVYIKPPNCDLSILQGSFTLLRPAPKERGAKMSVDIFFRHLADDQDGKAVGIILSGMGSDGTLGIRALKECAGMAMAQEPSSAKFEAMPQNAIATGLVDFIALPEDLPEQLISYVNASSKISQAQANIPQIQIARLKEISPKTPVAESDLARIFVLVRSRTGQDFSQYKRSTIMRRIERRMSLHQLTRLDDYVRLLQENPSEIEILAKEMLIGVTQFFRDPEAWHSFQKDVLPRRILSKPEDSMLRVWVVGCSTGEEAYTLAIILQESLHDLGKSEEVGFQIFATDTDSDAIDVARTGKYPSNIEMDVSPERLERFFSKSGKTYQISQKLRDRVTFAVHSVIRDPPFAHLDILSCRNLLIYLSPEMQKKLIQLFHYALDPGGILILGTSESISGYSDLFSGADSKYKIFQRGDISSPLHSGLGEPLTVFAVPPSAREARVQPPIAAKEPPIAVVVQEHLVEHFAPPSIVTTENGDIVYIQGQAGKYLYPSPGKANLNVLAMAREGLRNSILSALRVAAREKRDVEREETVRTNGELQRVRLIVQPIPKHPGRVDLYLVAFQDTPELEQAPPAKPIEGAGASEPDVRIAELERELTDTRTELQRNAEEKQSAQEELTSINEELQSTNEELQSTNEELTTSKEELQSMNEEILTVNSELQAKIVMLSQNQDDIRNLLQSTRIPMLFLDNNLKVRRFTDDLKQIVHLIESDIGRDITDLKINLIDESLPNDAQKVLDTLQVIEKQVKTTDEKWFQMVVRPYRTFENQIAGVVITFSDITTIKKLEQTTQYARNYAENIIATIIEPLIVLDADLRVVSANQSFYRAFHVNPKENVGYLLYELGNRQWDIPKLRKLLEDILKENTEFEGYQIEHDFPEIGHRKMLLNARRIKSDERQELILLAIEDITNRSAPEAEQLLVEELKD